MTFSVIELNKISTWGHWDEERKSQLILSRFHALFFLVPISDIPHIPLPFLYTYIYVLATVYACAEGLLFYVFLFTEFMKKTVSLLLTRSRARCIFSLSWLRFSNISWPICSVEKEIWVRKGDFGCSLQEYHQWQWVQSSCSTSVGYASGTRLIYLENV